MLIQIVGLRQHGATVSLQEDNLPLDVGYAVLGNEVMALRLRKERRVHFDLDVDLAHGLHSGLQLQAGDVDRAGGKHRSVAFVVEMPRLQQSHMFCRPDQRRVIAAVNEARLV